MSLPLLPTLQNSSDPAESSEISRPNSVIAPWRRGRGSAGPRWPRNSVLWLLLSTLSINLLLNTAASDVTKGEFRGAAPKSEKPAKAKTGTKRTTYPFYGTLDSIDEREHAIALKGKAKKRIIRTSSDTRILRDGLESSLAKAKPGDRVTGTVFKNASGQEEAVTLRISDPK